MAAGSIRKALIVAILGLVVCSTASAQDDGWDVTVDPARKLTIAEVQYGSGALLRVQCDAGRLDVLITGLSPNSSAGGKFVRTLQGGRQVDSYWSRSTSGTMLTSAAAARDARSIGAGGRLDLALNDRSTPFSVSLDLPQTSSGVDQVLNACGRPLVDPRDDLIDVNSLLLEPPRLNLAERASRYSYIRVEVSCIVSNGRLSACQSDNETPRDARVGAATALNANGYRLRLTDAAAEGRLLDVVLTGSRIRRPVAD